MRPVSQLTAFIAHIAVGILVLAAPASAATFFVNMDTTVTTDITGDETLATPDDQSGAAGGPAIDWDADNVDVIINNGLTMTGGAGGPGGSDTTNTGGKIGGFGGHGLSMWKNGGSVAGSGIIVYGGAGGAGGNGGSGGATDAAGGTGGDGGLGIYLEKTNQITLTNSLVQGGKGGNGGNAGDAAGDAANAAQGGLAGQGGAGIAMISSSNAIVTLNNVTVKGGNGGTGGASLANATNTDGGDGGYGFVYYGTNATITLGTSTLVQGGLGGAAGTGGTGGAAGNDGTAFLYGGLGGSLTNHGTLDSGTADALSIMGTPTSVDNHGLIGAGTGYAVRLDSASNVGTFTNHAGATMSSNGVAMSVLGVAASIINQGAIEATSSHSVIFDGSADVGLFHNKVGGVIQSAGNANTVTVGVNSSITTFINEGTIENTGPGGALNLIGTVGSFSNSGLIHANDLWSLLLNSPNVPDLIVNTGGTISTSGAGSAAVLIFTDLGAAAVTIDGGTLQGDKALWVSAAQTGAITVKNASLVGSVEFSNAEETLNVSGSSLNGDIVFTGTDNNMNFEQGGTTTIAAGTQFINTTFFSLLTGANVVSNSEQSSANSDILKLTMIATSKLILNEDFWVDDSTLNQGTIEIAAGKTLTANEFAGDGTYVFNVTDASTLAKVEAQGAFSKIDLTGAAIEVKLTNPSAMFANGTNVLLAEDLNNNAILGVTDGTAATDNSALLNFLLFRGDAPEIGLTSDLLFAQVQLALLADIAGEGDDPNSIALGAALDEIGLDGDADLDDLMLALAQLPTNKAINDVLDALLPETDGIAYDIATDMGDQALDVASKRLDTLLAGRLANEYRVASLAPVALRGSVNEGRGAGRFWAQAFGRAVDQSRHSYNTGYDAGSYGVAVGADTNIDKATAIGAAFSYTSTDADGNGVNRTDTEVESYQLTLYGDHLFDNAVYAKGLLAYGWHANDIARHGVGGIPGNTATGNYDADHITARAELGRAYKGGENLTLIPRAHLNAAWYAPDGYSEQGVGGLGLTVAPDDLTSVRIGLGILARWDITLSGDELFQPELRLDYRRDLTRERFETTSEFLGAPGIVFRTQGVEPAADVLNLGVGALLATAGGIDLRASYDLELKEDYTAHAGYVRAAVPF